MTRSALPRPRDRYVATALAALLAMVYLLSFNGQFRSIDEFALYSRAESLVQGYGLRTPQLAFQYYHHPVGPLEPGQPFLATPLYWLALQAPGVSNIAAVMLFNVLVTALTGAVLYALLRTLDLTQTVAVLTTLAWGIGTTAWPYARSFFREPLLGLFWLGATLACLRWQSTRRAVWALACLALMCAGLAVKISAVGALPVFGAALLWDARARRLALTWRRAALLVAFGVASVLAAAELYTLRYGNPPPIAEYLWQYPWRDGLLVAYGMLVSPVKGVLFYSPILVAAAIGWPSLIRKRGRAAFLVAALTLSLLYVYGPSPFWHGGHVVWGPRMMIPLLPLLALPIASALESRRVLARLWVALWSAIGLIVQFPAGIASWADAVWQLVPAFHSHGHIVGLDGIPWYSWQLLPRSPALVQVRDLSVRQLDLTWLRTLADGTRAYDLPLALGLMALAGLTLVCLCLLMRRQPGGVRRQRALALACALAVLVGSVAIMGRSVRNTNDHGGLTRADARAIATTISQAQDVPHTVVLVSNDFFVNILLGMLKGQFLPQWHSPLDPITLAQIMAQAPDAERVWLVVDRVHLPYDASPFFARDAFVQEGYLAGGQWIGGFELFQFLPPAPLERQQVTRRWENGLALRGLSTDAQQVRPGGALRVEMELAAEAPVSEDYVLFAQLRPAEGPALAAPDGQPQYGAAPTSTWAPGEPVVDRRAILVPEDAVPGAYELSVGWLDARGERVPPIQGEGTVRDDMVVLGEVVVLP